MDLTLIKLSLERLHEKITILENQNSDLLLRIEELEKSSQKEVSKKSNLSPREDTLIDTKEVLRILGISYNTLRSIVRKNLILPIRINQRRVRYSKKAIFNYIESRSVKPME